jgi:hypothetical protein
MANAPVVLNDEERMILATAIYKAKKANPDLPWKTAFAQARNALPAKRRLSEAIDHPKKVAWLTPLLEKLGGPLDSSQPKNLMLLDEEKRIFAENVLAALKHNPNGGYANAIRSANSLMPEDRRIGEKINGLNHLRWLKDMLELIQSESKKQKPQSRRNSESGMAKRIDLNKNEKWIFVKTFHHAKQNNSDKRDAACLREANKALPENRRLSDSLDSINQIPWIKPMLEQLEKITKRLPLNEDERIAFAKAFFEYKKANPEAGNLHAIRHANSLLPDDRKIGAQIDSVKQISWIIPLLEQLENPSKVKSRWECALSDKEKEQFAEIVYKLRKGNATWTHCMKAANSFMPEGHKIAASVVNPSGVPWLQRALAKLEEADKSKVVIDQRGSLPKNDEATAPKERKKYKQQGAKLFLSDEDKLYFAEIVYQLRKVNPGWGWQKILDEANSEMPAHKQRAHMPPTPSQITWLPSLLDEIGRRPLERYIPDPEPVMIPTIQTPTATPAPMMDMQAMMMAAFEKVVREQLAGGITIPTMNGAPQPVKIEQPVRKKIVVVGLLPVQTNDIQKRFGHKFDFKFIGSNTPNQQIRDSMKNADIGILMTRFVSHPTQAAMRDHPGFTFCNGNSTALENLLEEKLFKLDGQ